MKRPELSQHVSETQFRQFYYLKEELVSFCRQEKLQTSGNKQELTERIAHYLTTGEKKTIQRKARKNTRSVISLEDQIEEQIVCSESHRQFFKTHLGPKFSFNVAFQKWLKQNAGKTYQEALAAYQQIQTQKKQQKTSIDPQFEYNTYIRAFFAENQGKKLQQAIACWKYKKAQPGPNIYEITDLAALQEGRE